MKKNILVAFYSHSGNTEHIANMIAQLTEATLYKIDPMEKYPTDYNAVVSQAKKEIQAGYLPHLMNPLNDLKAFDIIFVGTPNWWSTIAPPVATFLTENKLAGKQVIPFCTHGGGGLSKIKKEIEKLCPNSKVLSSFDIYGSGGTSAKQKLADWLKEFESK